MRVIAVDDEKLALRQFEMEIEGVMGVELVKTFTNPLEALEYLKEHFVEAVFLDIEMPGMDGIRLGRELRKLYPEIVLIYISGYEQYVVDALHLQADYYLIKPYDRSDVESVMKRARLLAKRQKKKVRFRMLGKFDMFVDDSVVYFQNAKAKELIALCLERQGGTITMEEAAELLWEDREYDERVKNLYRKAVMDLKHLLKEYDVESVFQSSRGKCNLDVTQVDCDYYDLLAGKLPMTQEEYEKRDFLGEYPWAKATSIRLGNRLFRD